MKLIISLMFFILIPSISATIGYTDMGDTVKFWNEGSIENETFFMKNDGLTQFANAMPRFDWAVHEFGIAYEIAGNWQFESADFSSFTDRFRSDNLTFWSATANKTIAFAGGDVEIIVNNSQGLYDDYMRRDIIIRTGNINFNRDVYFYWKFKNINIDLDNDTDMVRTQNSQGVVNIPLDNIDYVQADGVVNETSIGDVDSPSASAITVKWNDTGEHKLLYEPVYGSQGNVFLLSYNGRIKRNQEYRVSYNWIDIPACAFTCQTSIPAGGCGFVAVIPFLEWRYNYTYGGQLTWNGTAGIPTNVSYRIRVYDFVQSRLCTNCTWGIGCTIAFYQNDSNGSLPLLDWESVNEELKFPDPNYVWRTCNSTYYANCKSKAKTPQYEDFDFEDDYNDVEITCHRPRWHHLNFRGANPLSSGIIRQNCTDNTPPTITNIYPLNNTYLGGVGQYVNVNCSAYDDGTVNNITLYYKINHLAIPPIKARTNYTVNNTYITVNSSIFAIAGWNYTYFCNSSDFKGNLGQGEFWYYYNLLEPVIVTFNPERRILPLYANYPLSSKTEEDFITVLLQLFMFFGV